MKGILTWVLSILFFWSFGQNSIDLFTGSYRYGPAQNTVEAPGEATESVALINLKVPIVFSGSTIWYNNLTYQASTVKYSADFPNTLNPTRLHGFIFQSGLVRQVNEKSAFQLLLVPRLMTDFKAVDSRHFQFGGIGLFEQKYNQNLTMRYGLMYNRELFGHMFVPLIYLNWSVSPKWTISGMLPIFAKVSYQASEKLSLGLSHFGLITSYQLGDAAFDGDYIERKSIDLTLFARYRLMGNLHFETRFGYALDRSYYQFARGDEMDFRVTILSFGDDREQKNVSFDPGPIIDFRVVYNLPLD